MSKSSFTTLNRWLGKKNKEKTNATANGKFSKSSSNLSISTTNLNEPSQLEYNRITPLPAATSNAPFEQTFRITVLLPKDQLYVCRLGARVPLSKLLELVCENKLLDPERYEFRNPVDASQVYDCELTIGAVGLSEIRLCHKSESYDHFNADEVMKLHRTNMRDSLSSSEFSSRNSKSQTTTKTPSPYSSSNSLNSMDSTGMNYTRTPVTPTKVSLTKQPPALTRQTSNTSNISANGKIAAPPRKKRAAPRPPSQMAIPEKSTLDTTLSNVDVEQTIEQLKSNTTLPRKDYYVSTPNLPTAALSATDCNGNIQLNGHSETPQTAEQQIQAMNARNLYSGSVQDLTSSTQSMAKLPEPSPRKRIMQMKKKTNAPAPPPRGSAVYSDNEDAMSIASNTASLSESMHTAPTTPLTPTTPQTPSSATTLSTALTAVAPALPRVEVPPDSSQLHQASPTPMKRETIITTSTTVTQITTAQQTTHISADTELSMDMPKPVPRQTSTTLLNATPVESSASAPTLPKQRSINVSKVMLNRTPTPEPRSLSTEPSELDMDDDDNLSKQADSGIGEPIPSPLPDSLPSEGSAHECKSTFESSSDDDEVVKVYNFKLCKTVKPAGEQKVLDDLTQFRAEDSGETTPVTLTQEPTPSSTDTTSWNFAIPISPPPTFADATNTMPAEQISMTASAHSTHTPDAPIQPKIKERPVLNFDAISTDSLERKPAKAMAQLATPVTPMPSPATPLNDIVDELSNIIHENRMDSLIKQAKAQPEIEAAKPNTLSNFSIGAIAQQTPQQQQQHQHSTAHLESFNSSTTISKVMVASTITTTTSSSSNSSTPTADVSQDDTKLYRKRGSITNLTSLQQQRKSLTRADSFQQTTSYVVDSVDANGLNSRSSSHLCLTKIEQNGLQVTKRRSSSELSIGESPSLQSLEVIKTILNSRKNSLATSSDGEGKANDETKITATAKAAEAVESRETVAEATKRIEAAAPTTTEQSPQTPEHAATNMENKETAEPKELPKTYRYSGPPSINFSTWNERPKAQVAIKNEGDYIFGGQQATKTVSETKLMPHKYRASTPAGTFNFRAHSEPDNLPPASSVEPKTDSTTARMGIPDKDYKVPITVKPLPDVTVELRAKPDATQTTTKTEPTNSAKVEYNLSKPNHISTLPRNFGNKRYSTPAQPTTTAVTVNIPGPALLRNTSISKGDNNQEKRSSAIYGSANRTTAPTVPFGQGTLRRTGLKEKILAQAQATSEQAAKENPQTESNVSTATFSITSSTKTAAHALTNGHTTTMPNKPLIATKSTTTTTIQSGIKSELQLQKHNSSRNSITVNELESAQLPTPQSAPIMPPPAPAMNSLKLKSFKSVPGKTSDTTVKTEDTRDALLEAIRNFRKDALNRI